MNAFVSAGSGGLGQPFGLLFGPDGNLYVSSINNSQVLRYDGTTGTFINAFVPPGSGGLSLPLGLVFGPDGNLYVNSSANNQVLRYDGATGTFIDIFVTPGSGGLADPDSLIFMPPGPAQSLALTGGADSFLLRVTTADINAGPFVIDVVVPATGDPGTVHEAVAPLNDDTYLWRVIARDAAGNTADSGVQTFTVDTVLPPAPVLIQPESGDLINDNTPLFEWTGDLSENTFGYLPAVTSGDLDQAFFDLFAAGPGDPEEFDPFHFDTGDVPGFDIFQPIVGDPFQGIPPGTQFQVPTGDELNDGVYQWKVIATDRAFNTAGSITQTFTLDATPPGTADLVAPEDNAFLNDYAPLFDWEASSEATGDVVTYRLQVTSGGAFIQPLAIDAVTTGDTTQFTGDALPDDTYQWRVIATDSALNASTSDTRSFSVDTLDPPTPTNLTDITVDPEDFTRTFTWNRSVDQIPAGGTPGDESGVDFYNVEITGPVIVIATADDVCPAGVCQFSKTLPAGRYTIRVSAVDRATNESPFTAPVEFAAGPTGVVSGLAVVDPVFGNTVSTPFPEIQWGPPVVLPDPADTGDGGIKTYEVAITGDPVLAPGFNVPFTPFDSPRAFAAECIIDGIRIGVASQCRSATGDGDLIIITIDGLDSPLAGGAPDGTHTLGVRIVPEVGITGDVTEITFTVDTTPPGQPALVSPANAPARASFLKDSTPFFDWAAPGGEAVDSYRLLVTSGDINTGPVFIDQVIAGALTSFQAQPADDLPDGTYEWVVVASDQALNVATSDTRTFTVDTVAPAPPGLVLPAQNELLNVRTPFFDWIESPTTGDVFDYRLLVVSGDIGTGAVVIDVVELHPKTDFVTIADLADGGYQWQVISRDKALNTSSSVTRSFTIDATAPGIPNLLLPPNGEFLSTNTPLFEWETAAGDVFNYELRVTSGDIINGPFDIQEFVPAPFTSDQTVTPLNDGTYVWRVIARDLAGNPQQYGIRTFTVAPAPAPTLISPASGDFINDDAPFFEWTPSAGNLDIDVFDYLLQVTSADTFNPHLDIEVVIPRSGTGHQVQPADFLANATYRWRVIARDRARNLTTSDIQAFTLDTVSPAPPVLLLPESGDLTNDNTPFFDWTAPEGEVVESYRLQVVASGGTFNQPLDIDEPIPGNTTQFLVPPGSALVNAVYQWRVIARDAAGNPATSDTRSFRVDTRTDAPVLVFPIAGSTVGTQTPTLSWTHSDPSTPVTYDLLITSDTVGAPFALQATVVGAFIFTPSTDLPVGLGGTGDYFWSVRATDAAGTGNTADSVVERFTVNLNKPVVPMIISPLDQASNVPIPTTIQWFGVALADFYDLDIATGDFATTPQPIRVSVAHSGDESVIQTALVQTLAPGTLYEWRVSGRDADTGLTGDFSAPAAFITSGDPQDVTLDVSLQRTGDIHGPVEFRVRLYTKDAFRPDIAVTPWRLFESTPVQTFTLELIQTGGAAGLQELSAEDAIEAVDLRTGDRTFTLVLRGVTPGFYDIAIEANHTLVNLRDDVPVHTLMGILDMGTKDGPNPQPLREGNAIDDPRPGVELASIANALDASLLVAAFGTSESNLEVEFEGDLKKFDRRADFDRDGDVDNDDFQILKDNFLRFSPLLVVP